MGFFYVCGEFLYFKTKYLTFKELKQLEKNTLQILPNDSQQTSDISITP